MKRKSSTPPKSASFNAPKSKSSSFNSATLAILAGVFVLGIGLGVVFSSTANFNPENVASIQFIDEMAPNAEVCQAYGASATVTDMRVFVTYKPFNVYVSQPLIQPGCVLRNSNMPILEQKRLVSSEKLRECKQRLNTFGFTGKLDNSPQINCVYQSDSEKNRFLNTPGVNPPPPETNRF